MPDIKNEKEQDLKSADARKSGSQSVHSNNLASELFQGRKVYDVTSSGSIRVKKKLPLIVDIIIGILMIAMVCALIVGSYMLFRYYSDDYNGVDIEYTVVYRTSSPIADYINMENKGLYLDTEDNAIYYGEIIDVRMQNGEGKDDNALLLTVSSTVKHKRGEGYSIEDKRLAVGSELCLRCDDITMDVTVVELAAISSGGK